MSKELVKADEVDELPNKVLAAVTAGGDLSTLTQEEQSKYIVSLCRSIGLNELSRPIQLIKINGVLVPYAVKDATDQLRKLYSVSLSIPSREIVDGVLTVTARATLPNGRTDEDIGSLPIGHLKGEALANAMMKCTTKAKRRVTLSICGLGFLDESELDTMQALQPVIVHTPVVTSPAPKMGEIVELPTAKKLTKEDYSRKFADAKDRAALIALAAESKGAGLSEREMLELSNEYYLKMQSFKKKEK